MAINRETSKQTWKQLDELIYKIKHRALELKDDELWGLADKAFWLLRQHSEEVAREEEEAKP